MLIECVICHIIFSDEFWKLEKSHKLPLSNHYLLSDPFSISTLKVELGELQEVKEEEAQHDEDAAAR